MNISIPCQFHLYYKRKNQTTWVNNSEYPITYSLQRTQTPFFAPRPTFRRPPTYPTHTHQT